MAHSICLHIGTLKTGSTSLQQYVWDHRPALGALGIGVYTGAHIPQNHTELFLATMRDGRDSFAGLKWQLVTDEAYTARVAARLSACFDSTAAERIVLTSEGLSLLRYPDETRKLAALLQHGRHEIDVVLYLRNRRDFLRSYRAQILKVKGRRFSDDPDSSLYAGRDSWLLDYDNLVAVYRDAFGAARVRVIDYDAELARVGSVIPSFVDCLGANPQALPDPGGYWLNQTATAALMCG